MVSGVTPPTTNTGALGGKTAFIAFSTAGDAASAGNSFSPSAPAARAAKASPGVNMPGRLTRPRALAAAITAASVLGETISLPPASATASTASTVSTVPAPTSRRSPKASLMRRMLSSGSGELSGTSRERKPASCRTAAISRASSGLSPRRMATRGSSAIWSNQLM